MDLKVYIIIKEHSLYSGEIVRYLCEEFKNVKIIEMEQLLLRRNVSDDKILELFSEKLKSVCTEEQFPQKNCVFCDFVGLPVCIWQSFDMPLGVITFPEKQLGFFIRNYSLFLILSFQRILTLSLTGTFYCREKKASFRQYFRANIPRYSIRNRQRELLRAFDMLFRSCVRILAFPESLKISDQVDGVDYQQASTEELLQGSRLRRLISFLILYIFWPVRAFHFLCSRFYRKCIIGKYKKKWQIYWRNSAEKEVEFTQVPLNENELNADPFLVQEDGHLWLFYENMKAGEYGRLFVCDLLVKDSAIAPVQIIPEKFHMSFPAVFRYQNEFYMLPETKSTNDIRLYKTTFFPFAWKHYYTLLSNIRAVDSIIYEKDGFVYLFTTVYPFPDCEFAELRLYYSQKLFSQKWVEHPRSPISLDVFSNRAAGFIIEEHDEAFRIVQNGTGEYGVNINFMKIDEISPVCYREHFETKFLYKGLTHTYNKAAQYTVIDAKEK